MTKKIKEFYGPFEVDKVEDLSDKTYLGNDRVKVTFTNGETRELPKEMFNRIKTNDAVTDLAEFRDKRVNFVLESLQVIFAENEVSKEDLEYIVVRIPQIFNALLTSAVEKKFGKPMFMVSLADIDKIINERG